MTNQHKTVSTAEAFFNELDQMRRHADSLQNELMLANDQLRTAGIEAEKAANRLDLLIDANDKLQRRADMQQGRADRAYIKLETLGRIMIQGIEDVLRDARQSPPINKVQIDPRSVDMLKDEFQKDGLIPAGAPIPPEQGDLISEADILSAFAKTPVPPPPRFGSGPRRTHPHDHGQE